MSRLIRNQLPGNGLRVRVPCPPLWSKRPAKPRVFRGVFFVPFNGDKNVRFTDLDCPLGPPFAFFYLSPVIG